MSETAAAGACPLVEPTPLVDVPLTCEEDELQFISHPTNSAWAMLEYSYTCRLITSVLLLIYSA